MAYRIDLRDSARRHLQAAGKLDKTCRRDVAGYLYGVAAECALKELMRASGMRRLDTHRRREDPFYAHFPELKTLLADQAQGRWATRLRKFAEDQSFMQNWHTEMRYAPKGDIVVRDIERWRKHAEKAVAAMEEPW